jgi:hypothetical protein
MARPCQHLRGRLRLRLRLLLAVALSLAGTEIEDYLHVVFVAHSGAVSFVFWCV